MKVLRKLVQIAALLILLAAIVQSDSSSDAEVQPDIVKGGPFDCPHDCWGDICK